MKALVSAVVLAAMLIPTAAFALPQSGETAPALNLPTASGSFVSLAALRGRPVYLSVFATWCGPCNDEAPALEAVAKKYQAAGLAVVGIDEEESAARAQAFARKYGLTYPIALDTSGAAGDGMGITAAPTNIFIGRDGRVSFVHVGEMTPAEINAAIRRLL